MGAEDFLRGYGICQNDQANRRTGKGTAKKMAETQKESNLLRLQPCKGAQEIRQQDEEINRLDKSMHSLDQQIRELEKKRREMMSEAMKQPGYGSPFS